MGKRWWMNIGVENRKQSEFSLWFSTAYPMAIVSDKNNLIMLLIDIDWIFNDRLLAIDNDGYKCSRFPPKFKGRVQIP